MTTPNLPAALDQLKRGLESTHARNKAHEGAGEQYLKLAKSGIWTYGADGIDVQDGSLWAVDPNSFIAGYIAWQPDSNKAAEKLGEEMRPATDPPVIRGDLPDVGGPWDEQLGCTLLCLTGEDAGTRVSYNTTSKGGLRAINGLLGHVVTQLQKGETDAIVPVVRLLTDSYQHKRYGKIYTPEFEIVKWESLSSTPATAAAAVTDEPPPAAAPPAAPEPSRRRRRKAA